MEREGEIGRHGLSQVVKANTNRDKSCCESTCP